MSMKYFSTKPLSSNMNSDLLLHEEHWIVVVGRNNFSRSSRSLEQMVRDLQSSGFYVHSFESRQAQRSRRRNDWFECFLGGAVATFCSHHARLGRWLQKFAKLIWVLVHPSDWDFSRLTGATYNECAARNLRQLLRDWQCRWPTRRVHLFSHSAGGIISSWLEKEPNVVSLVCFGYPFRHPDMQDQPFRTAHLQSMKKPFLIIQGDHDEYGTAEHAKQYMLSDSINVVSIDSGHDYDDLTLGLHQHCLELVGRYFGSHARCSKIQALQ